MQAKMGQKVSLKVKTANGTDSGRLPQAGAEPRVKRVSTARLFLQDRKASSNKPRTKEMRSIFEESPGIRAVCYMKCRIRVLGPLFLGAHDYRKFSAAISTMSRSVTSRKIGLMNRGLIFSAIWTPTRAPVSEPSISAMATGQMMLPDVT